MSDKTGNPDWDDFKRESEAIEQEMKELEEQIDDLIDSIQKGEES